MGLHVPDHYEERDNVPVSEIRVVDSDKEHWEAQGMEKPLQLIGEKEDTRTIPVVEVEDGLIAINQVWEVLAAKQVDSVTTVDVVIVPPDSLGIQKALKYGVVTQKHEDAWGVDEDEDESDADDSGSESERSDTAETTDEC